MLSCPICGIHLSANASILFYKCYSCNHWIAKFETSIADAQDAIFEQVADGDSAIYFLDDVRRAASKIILDQLVKLGPGKLLDVGCASGLFLELAEKDGFEVQGIEPNKKMSVYPIKKGLPVHVGFFPDILDDRERFKFIIFNDVLEHIEDIHSTLGSCNEFLEADGFLTINVPNCNGLFFRIAIFLNLIGYAKPWNRLWQTMFYTPHLHYFSPQSLVACVENHGFQKISGPIYLPVIGLVGLWGRISADSSSSFITRVIQYTAVLFIYPIYIFSTKDSFFVVFQKS